VKFTVCIGTFVDVEANDIYEAVRETRAKVEAEGKIPVYAFNENEAWYSAEIVRQTGM